MPPMIADQPPPIPRSSREQTRKRLENYVYVIEFSSGTVKVGQTTRPQARLNEHSAAAQAHGHSFTRSWVSTAHLEYKANEGALIAFCDERWPLAVGNEAFQGADYDAVVEYAQGLPYTRLSEDALTRRLGEEDDTYSRWEARRVERLAWAKIKEMRQKVDLVLPLVNDENRWTAADALYELAKEAIGALPTSWASEDPTAAERCLVGRGAPPEVARRTHAEFELNFRTLYAIEFHREAQSFEDIARFCDMTTGELGGAS